LFPTNKRLTLAGAPSNTRSTIGRPHITCVVALSDFRVFPPLGPQAAPPNDACALVQR
jgi:hypothetical protein